MNGKKIRVLVADDHPIVRDGLRGLVNGQADMAIVGEAADAQETLALAVRLRPEIVLLDLSMPGGGGLPLIRVLKEKVPGVRVLVLTMQEDLAVVREVLHAGGAGYLVKKAVDSELLLALRAVERGEIYVHSSLTQAVWEEAGPGSRSDAPAADRFDLLSKREKEIFQWLVRGYSNQEVADKLGVSVKTVESHRAHVLEKLSLHSRADLVRYALAHGLLTPEASAP